MKTIKAAAWVWLCLGAAAHVGAQGLIRFNNLEPGSGRVWVDLHTSGYVLLDRDISFRLRAGPSGPAGWTLDHTWLVSDGSAAHIAVGPGLFDDPMMAAFAIPGVQPGELAEISIQGLGR